MTRDRLPRLVVLQSGDYWPMRRGWDHPDAHNLYHSGRRMKLTRRQRRIENKRRHRALRKLSVVTYDDLIRMHDRNPRRCNPEVEGILLIIDHSEGRPIVSHGVDLRTNKLVILPQEHPSDRQFGAVRIPGLGWVIPPDRNNPRVSFRARGKRVTFRARARRRGAVPRQLRPYVFKRGR